MQEDLDDNGHLDCLFNNQPYHNDEESSTLINKRLKANWTSECSFNAYYDWKSELYSLYNIPSLVDVNGNS